MILKKEGALFVPDKTVISRREFVAKIATIGIIVAGPAFGRRRFIPKPATAGASYQVEQNFSNGSGTTPGAPTSGGSWTNSSGTWNFSNTSPALPHGGNNAKGGADFSGGTAFGTFTAQGEAWFFSQYYIASTEVNDTRILALRDSGGTEIAWVRYTGVTGVLAILNNASEGVACVTTCPNATAIYLYAHYKRNPSAGILELAFSTDGTKPTIGSNNYCIKTDCSADVDVAQIAINYGAGNVLMYWDRVLVNNSVITANP